jgi:hypothetical protein
MGWKGWGILKESDHLEHLGEDGRIIFKRSLKTLVWKASTGLIWLMLGTSGGLF